MGTRLLLASGLCPALFQCLPVGTGCLFQAGILIRSPVVSPAPQPASPPPSFAGTRMNGKREALSGLCSPTPVAAEFQITPQTKPKQAAPCVPLSPLSSAFSHQAWQPCCSSVARHMRAGEDGLPLSLSLLRGLKQQTPLPCLLCRSTRARGRRRSV